MRQLSAITVALLWQQAIEKAKIRLQKTLLKTPQTLLLCWSYRWVSCYGRASMGKLWPRGHTWPVWPRRNMKQCWSYFPLQFSCFPTRWRTLDNLTFVGGSLLLHICISWHRGRTLMIRKRTSELHFPLLVKWRQEETDDDILKDNRTSVCLNKNCQYF